MGRGDFIMGNGAGTCYRLPSGEVRATQVGECLLFSGAKRRGIAYNTWYPVTLHAAPKNDIPRGIVIYHFSPGGGDTDRVSIIRK